MATAAEELPFARQERLRFVEATLIWEGSIQRSRVCEIFGVSANHVTRDLTLYEEQHPGSLEYRPRQRAYVPGPNFSPIYASDDPAQILGLLQTRAETGSIALLPLLGGEGIDVTTLPSPAMGVDKSVLRDVLRAIRQSRGLSVHYHSLSAEETIVLTLWPHALFNTGVRWYVRAYDDRTQGFREFALSRIDRPVPQNLPSPYAASSDIGWTTEHRIEVVPHPKLNAHQQRVVAREFPMKRDRIGWVWSLSVRQCLIGYFARRYRLDAKLPVSPLSHWIVLRNRATLKPFFLPLADENENE